MFDTWFSCFPLPAAPWVLTSAKIAYRQQVWVISSEAVSNVTFGFLETSGMGSSMPKDNTWLNTGWKSSCFRYTSSASTGKSWLLDYIMQMFTCRENVQAMFCSSATEFGAANADLGKPLRTTPPHLRTQTVRHRPTPPKTNKRVKCVCFEYFRKTKHLTLTWHD